MKKSAIFFASLSLLLFSCSPDPCDCVKCCDDGGMNDVYGVNCVDVIPDCWDAYGDGLKTGSADDFDEFYQRVKEKCK